MSADLVQSEDLGVDPGYILFFYQFPVKGSMVNLTVRGTLFPRFLFSYTAKCLIDSAFGSKDSGLASAKPTSRSLGSSSRSVSVRVSNTLLWTVNVKMQTRVPGGSFKSLGREYLARSSAPMARRYNTLVVSRASNKLYCGL